MLRLLNVDIVAACLLLLQYMLLLHGLTRVEAIKLDASTELDLIQNSIMPALVQQHLRKDSVRAANSLLQQHKPLTWIRYGDGELMCLTGMGGSNINGESYDGPMCNELAAQFEDYGSNDDSNLFIVLGTWFLNGYMGDATSSFLEKHRLQPNFHGFVDSFYLDLLPPPLKLDQALPDPSSFAESAEQTEPLPWAQHVVPLLRDSHVVLVGPSFLQTLEGVIGYKRFVEVPAGGGAFAQEDRVMSSLIQESEAHPNTNVVTLFAAGTAAKVMSYKLWQRLGHKDSFVDVGSSLDGLAGRSSRDYNSDLTRFCKQHPYFIAEELWAQCKEQLPASLVKQILSLAPSQLPVAQA